MHLTVHLRRLSNRFAQLLLRLRRESQLVEEVFKTA